MRNLLRLVIAIVCIALAYFIVMWVLGRLGTSL